MARTVNEEKRLERRKRILEEAVILFAENGYSNTTTALIAKNIGVTSGTIFQYFPNKEALFHAAVLEPLEDIQKKSLALLQQNGTPAELLKNMVKDQFDHIYFYTNELRLVQSVLGQRIRFPELTQKVLDSIKVMTDKIESVYAEGQSMREFNPGFSPAMISRSYISFLNGVALTLGEDIVHHPEWENLKAHAYYLFAPVQHSKN
ncbi:AcrR family transcriptional regulator [Paenibacillus intestini]|uniref:TetR/AcrR family transcriptional regulator n=1 Tax=Paenibacillus cucumis (ex Kampfer et al. 2016) TaxID=1776858 RepID=A0ABS7KKL9_9BACL|nr:TetR/AcrR family transcriptional regulator [Paenibacillus cucumis (ex Kampfer et al. 2016)]MBY0204729.1 TetR/AcrR family transcriptional regulator [Paenibacillus cucumis (ex Kampfer et al. 2016)]MDP9702365.1 AcrR family transcriptional regulator [Paenibacillus intestini]